MKEVYAHPDFEHVALRRTVLEASGIPCFIRNDTGYRFADAFGGLLACFLPLAEWWPNLCVIDPDDYEDAVEMLRTDTLATDPTAWRCERCGEEVPRNFEACWNCSTPNAPSLIPD